MKAIKQYSKVKIINVRPDLKYTLGEGEMEIGNIGWVVEIYKVAGRPDGYEVECVMENGDTKWMAVFYREDIEPI